MLTETTMFVVFRKWVIRLFLSGTGYRGFGTAGANLVQNSKSDLKSLLGIFWFSDLTPYSKAPSVNFIIFNFVSALVVEHIND